MPRTIKVSARRITSTPSVFVERQEDHSAENLHRAD
jgi:hypothetical protein